jgi:acetyl esterase/lipase
LDRRDILGLGLAAGALTITTPLSAARGARSPFRRIALWPQSTPEASPTGLMETLTERSKEPAVRDRALTGVIAPWLDHARPIRPNGAAIIVIPGGGYRHMAWDKEALDVAAWFAVRGVAGFALAYRLPQEGWQRGLDTPLADAQRAVRVVRSRAREWGIDPTRIAVVGFSAGGHLAANLAAQHDRQIYPGRDVVDSLSARPDLAAPIYPAVLLEQLAASLPPGQSLFGKTTSASDLVRHSPHLLARADAPPHFLLHAEDDPLVSPEHSLALRSALKAKGVSVETHLHAKGGHGFGLRHTAGTSLGDWPQRLLAFGRTTGWIK